MELCNISYSREEKRWEENKKIINYEMTEKAERRMQTNGTLVDENKKIFLNCDEVEVYGVKYGTKVRVKNKMKLVCQFDKSEEACIEWKTISNIVLFRRKRTIMNISHISDCSKFLCY